MKDPLVKICDVAYVRLGIHDLDVMEKYLFDCGMLRSARTASTLFMRGTGPSHHVHISEKGGEAGLAAFGFLVRDTGDLETLSNAPGASAVHDTGEPGGGRRVVLHDPWGQIHEHYTDGDLLNAGHSHCVHSIEEGGSQWGPEMPPDLGRTIRD